MTNQEILQNNKLIAEFMYPNFQKEYESGEIEGDIAKKAILLGKYYSLMKYPSLWDWLMPVIEKIDNTECLSNKKEKYYYCVDLMGSIARVQDSYTGDCIIHILMPENNWIKCTYKLIIEFINWYNKNK